MQITQNTTPQEVSEATKTLIHKNVIPSMRLMEAGPSGQGHASVIHRSDEDCSYWYNRVVGGMTRLHSEGIGLSDLG